MPPVAPSVARLNPFGRFPFREPSASIDYLIVGAGVVGLAVTRQLALSFSNRSTFLVERHAQPGQEISSRNSEVIHAGLYYKQDSLKTRLSIRGRELLYSYCRAKGVPHRNLGKLVVGSRRQLGNLKATHDHVELIREAAVAGKLPGLTADIVPTTQFLSGDEARELEPDLGPDIAGALLSPTTGIVDSHALMQSLESDIIEANGSIAYSTRVVRVDPHPDGFAVQLQTGGEGAATDTIVARTLINASGLSANLIWNSLRPDTPVPMYFARGSYASYTRKRGAERVSHLLYPVPDADAHAFASLGTHLTLDMHGNIRFGPDLEWIQPPDTIVEGQEDHWWQSYYQPRELKDEARAIMYEAISKYLPRIEPGGLHEDYVGIRPKLVGPDGGFRDFEVRVHGAAEFGGGEGRMISLLGIESPGLTSSLALGEYVAGLDV